MEARATLQMITSRLAGIRKPLLVSLGLVTALLGISMIAEGSNSKPLTPYQHQLQAEVQNANGSPANGRDPASQMQTSLAAAASQPAGVGLRASKVAANVTGDQSHHVQPSSVLPDPKKTGMYSNGCLVGYANPGQTCVTSSTPGATPASCNMNSSLPCVVQGLQPKKP